jgi:uncharacterized phage infection (PIP) family protein YhgE
MNEIEQIIKDLQAKEAAIHEDRGMLKQLLSQLNDEFGLKSEEEAEKWLAKMDAELSNMEAQRDEDLEKFKSEFGYLLK